MSKITSFFSKSFYDYLENLRLTIPLICLLIFFYILSYFSVYLNHKLLSSLALTVWLVIFSLISILAVSYVSCGLIGMSKEIISKKRSPAFFKYSKKFFLRNFVIILIIILIYNTIRLVSFYSAYYIGKSLTLSVENAQILFTSIYFIGLAGLAIFFTFSNFYLVIKDYSIIKSIKRSFSLVKKEYLNTLTIILIFFVLISFIDTYINYSVLNIISVGELIKTLFVYPILFLVLSRFFVSKQGIK